MSYQVLARKLRPGSFPEIVGQEHVLRAMVNALNQQRLHHAYLFTGTRGVGKTTLARILAKCLNCETGISATPCGECDACVEISQGRFVDLIEVDAASRTRVDDTRELLDNVQYAPTRGRYKVYLIDEVHMLSSHSFNALLKTLEEPPPHVKFLLATTDPQKLPVTVLSRCLQFNLKRVPELKISGYLEEVLTKEDIEFEPAGLKHIAHAADGSMRDALSLLDQAIGYGDGRVVDRDVVEMLGSVSSAYLISLMQALIHGDIAQVMTLVDELASLAPDYDNVLSAMISLLHDLALVQQVPDALSLRGHDVQALSPLASHASPEEIQLYYEIALRARRDLALLPEPRYGLEMALLRMHAFKPAGTVSPPPAASIPSAPDTQPQEAAPARAEPSSVAVSTVSPASVEVPPTSERPMGDSLPPGGGEGWESIVGQLGLAGMSKMFANHCSLISQEDNLVALALSKRHDSLKNDTVVAKLETALQSYYRNEGLRVRIELQDGDPESPAARQKRHAAQLQLEAEASISVDPVVGNLKAQFGAEVVPGSVRPDDRAE